MQENQHDCPAQLEQLRREFEEFAYIVSHDLKAPVRAISNLAAWIEDDLNGTVPEDVKANIDLLRNRSARLENMIAALLQFSRIGRMDLETGTVDVEAAVRKMVSEQWPEAQLQTEGLPVLETYNRKLCQVLQILLENAVRFNPEPQKTITVHARESGNFYEFIVSDNGPGIPVTASDKIFTIFYTVQPKDTVNTTGAGLAIARKIVQFAGGEIRHEPNTGQGATIAFTWPKKLADTSKTLE